MGCFWGSEKLFNSLFPSLDTEVGYVSSGLYSQPVEVVKIITPKPLLSDILAAFFKYHYAEEDPDYPVPDRYQSVIFADIDTFNDCKAALERHSIDRKLRTKIVGEFSYQAAHAKHQKRYLTDHTVRMNR